ncbi:nonribosomal peptide synthetase [Apiospora phragmitis]|uniref:Nonribosomal peptide synthetase n=1 Tax=Apiospora phragmitis TaxID=2905665 RepID=A0ABR1STI7_9PEZI
MLRQTDRVLLNAELVNFDMLLESFEPHVHVVRKPADFAVLAANRVAALLLSSIGKVDRWDPKNGEGPEDRFGHQDLLNTAYGRIKAVNGMISKMRLRGIILGRVGQFAEAESYPKLWGRQNMIPILASSVAKRWQARRTPRISYRQPQWGGA